MIKSFSFSDQIFFAQRLSLLIDSNLSLIESLKIIKSMDISMKRLKVYNSIISDFDKGISLSKSIERSNAGFNKLLITLIKNGEQSGALSISLLQISNYLEKRNELKKKIISIMIYPIFIFISTICMSIFLIIYIFPKILPMLGTLNIQLPLITRIVKFIYELSISYGLYIIIILLIFIFTLYILLRKFIKLRKIIYQLLLKLPIIRVYIKLNTNLTLCSICEMLLLSGKSLSDFHIFAIDSLNNLIFKNAFENIYRDSIQGITFSNSMKKYQNIFPNTMISMCEIGERTGNLGNMMGHCSKIFEQDLDTAFKRFSSLIEPILMIFMGIIVGSIALSIILPVYEITNHLNK